MACGQGPLARGLEDEFTGALQRSAATAFSFSPRLLHQHSGGREPRIERLMDAMFFEDVGRDERQLVDRLSEYRGHASRSDRHEVDSEAGGRNLQRATERMGSR